MGWWMNLEYAAISDRGIMRDKNEDFWNVVLGMDGKPQAFIVADGMGGHVAGDVASRMAVETISNKIASRLQQDDSADSVKRILEEAVLEANEAIYQYALQTLNGLGTNNVNGRSASGKLTIAHIATAGFIYEKVLSKINPDHSFHGELIEKGIFDPEEAREHPLRNQITRALGAMKSKCRLTFMNLTYIR